MHSKNVRYKYQEDGLLVTLDIKEEIDLEALNLLSSGVKANLLRCVYEEKAGRHTLFYSMDKKRILSLNIKQREFRETVSVISAYVSLLRLSMTNNLVFDNFMLNAEYILYSDENYQFVYIPIVKTKQESVKKVLQKAIVSFRCKDDRIKELINHLKKTKTDNEMLECLERFTAKYNDSGKLCKDGDFFMLEEEETSLLSEEVATSLLSEPATAFYEDEFSESETTLFSVTSVSAKGAGRASLADEKEYDLYLIRNANGEKIPVSGNIFMLGKDQENMNYVLENNSVSRHHASIIYENGTYYIMDNKSTNGTRVEGVELMPYERVELSADSIITLGNESFQIQIERRG